MKKVVISGFAAGLGMLAVSLVLMQIYNALFPSLQAEYQNSSMFRPWSDPLMSLYFLHPFVLGLALAFIFDKVKELINGKTIFEKAFVFALIFWLVATIPGMFISYSSFQLSLLMVLSWSFSGLIQAFVAGLILIARR